MQKQQVGRVDLPVSNAEPVVCTLVGMWLSLICLAEDRSLAQISDSMVSSWSPASTPLPP